jgi:hypothetical protein
VQGILPAITRGEEPCFSYALPEELR